MGWGGHGVCISRGLEEEVGLFWAWSAQVSRPWIKSHLVLAFPSLPSPYTSQENLRPYLEEHSPTFVCNLSKGPVVIILNSFKGHFCLWVTRSFTKIPSTFWCRKRERPKLVVYSQSWDKPSTKHPLAPKLAEVLSPLSASMATQTPHPASASVEGRRYCFWGTAAPGSCSVVCKVLCSLPTLYRCFRINIFMGALRPQQCTNCFCCRGRNAGSDPQPALSCWLTLPGSTHTRTPAPTHLSTNSLQAAQGEQRAGAHLPTENQPPARNGGGCSGKGWSSLPAPVCPAGLQSAEYGTSEGTSASRQGDPPWDRSSETPSSRRHGSLQALSILARRGTPWQTIPPLLMARMEAGRQGSLRVVSPVSSVAISYFSIRFLGCRHHSWRA